ncbi:hypothetical protein [Pacificispira sp.]|uniref:hypothetical protein n=1 Tax=Pacificispira sp. TaxID=2888761 RepID=UPI003BA9D71E
MSYVLRLAIDRTLIVGFMWGHVNPDDILSGIRNPEFDPAEAASLDTLILVDPDARLSDLTPQVGREIALADKETYFSESDQLRHLPVKLAVVCPNPVSLVTMRLLFGMTDQIADYDEDRQTFEDMESALTWLDRPEPDRGAQLIDEARRMTGAFTRFPVSAP